VRRQKTKELIVAVPVAPRESIDKLARVADRIIVIHCCSSSDNVGEHYRDFTEVGDDEVESIMCIFTNPYCKSTSEASLGMN
jgi:putative phosphoribosyl transferase